MPNWSILVGGEGWVGQKPYKKKCYYERQIETSKLQEQSLWQAELKKVITPSHAQLSLSEPCFSSHNFSHSCSRPCAPAPLRLFAY